MGRSTTTRSSHISTETIGEPPKRASAAKGGRERHSSGSRARSAGAGTADTTASAVSSRASAGRPAATSSRVSGPLPVAHAADAGAFDDEPLHPGAATDDPAPPLEVGGDALEQRTPAPAQEDEAGGPVVPQERLLVDAVEEHGRHALHRLVEDGERQGVPEQPPRRLALAAAAEVLREGQALGPPAEPDGEPHPDRLQLHRQRHAQAEEARQQVQGRAERRAVEGGHALLVHPLELEVVLGEDEVRGAGPPDEVERRGVGAHHQVGAVVHVLAGDRVARRGGPPAEDAAPLEQHDLVPPLLESDGRGEAREPSPDHDDLHRPHRTRGIVRSAIQILRGLPSCTRSPPTGWPRRAHSSRTAR